MLKQLSGLDSMFLYLDKARTPLAVGSLQIYDPATAPGGELDFREVLAVFESRLDRSSVFRRKLHEVPLSLDHPYWVEDEHFDIGYHVRHISLPKPGSWRQLMIQVSRLLSQPLDKSKPLWEAYVLEGLDSVEGLAKGCFAIFLKIHHATIDGVSGMDMQVAMHDRASEEEDRSDQRQDSRGQQPDLPGNWSLLARSPLNAISKSTKLAMEIACAAPGLIQAGLAWRTKPGPGVPKTVFNVGRASAGRVMDARFFDLAEMKEISRSIDNTTINDVVLTVVSGALRKYLKSKGHLPGKSMVAACPVNIRRQDGNHDGHDNMVSIMNASLHSDIADPVKRMHAIHGATREAKTLTQSIGAGTLAEIPMNLPAPVARNLLPAAMGFLTYSGIRPFNTIITNVTGSQQPLYFAGAKMIRLMGIGPVLDMAGLFHAVFSYAGGISISFTACREMLPDPAFYVECIEESYSDIRHAVFPVRKSEEARQASR
jgi:WS/DGAT/MGAT family acyltransferase